ncbi:MAG: hypothetical protein IT317_21505 [Anaerolineales bacterium]|nr:hypothetical protein [Anaerolineales bacterium]
MADNEVSETSSPGERLWAEGVAGQLHLALAAADTALAVEAGRKLLYANEVVDYRSAGNQIDVSWQQFETDLLVREVEGETWKPRVVIETKLRSVTTHDAITYSQKAVLHKQVHPYLRYGILLGDRLHHPLPGRLFRHGAHFDFMTSWVDQAPTPGEFESLLALLLEEVSASRQLEEILKDSRSRSRNRYTTLHRRLHLFVAPPASAPSATPATAPGAALPDQSPGPFAESPSVPPEAGPAQVTDTPPPKAGALGPNERLRDYLRSLPLDISEIELTWDQLDQIRQQPLPNSAREHSAWWDNASVNAGHSQARGWLDAGWEKVTFSKDRGTVRFRRSAGTQHDGD